MPAAGTSKFQVTQEIINKVEAIAAQGLTNVQIGDAIGIGDSTVYKYKKNNVEFAEAIKRGQAKGISTITNALFIAAKRGNITAQIFYLKNRAPEEWKDRIPEGGQTDQPIPDSYTVKIVDARKKD